MLPGYYNSIVQEVSADAKILGGSPYKNDISFVRFFLVLCLFFQRKSCNFVAKI